jgi:hypothetical protein
MENTNTKTNATQIKPYSISAWGNINGKLVTHRVTLAAIISGFGADVPAYVMDLNRNGARYPFEDYDVMAAAMRELDKRSPGAWERLSSRTLSLSKP